MTIRTKLIILTAVSLLITSIVIGVVSLVQLSSTGKESIAQIRKMGNEEIHRLETDGKKEIETFRNDLMARKKEYLKSQVQTAIGVLDKGYKDSHSFESIKATYEDQLQNAVDTAYSILVTVESESGLSLTEKKYKAMELIRVLRYGPENKDYFWINDEHPRMVMHPIKPQLEGNDLSKSKDPNGKRLFVEFVKACQSGGQGFVDYLWPKPGFEKPQPKLSYVKLFEPWGWIIGSGVYLEVAEERLKNDSAGVIGALRFGPESKDYFWINDMHPRMVMHPIKPALNGKDLSGNKDTDGKALFVEMANVCRDKGEGFVAYQWPKPGSEKPQPKLSFVKLFKEWGWILGTGIYIDDIEAAVSVKNEIVAKRVQNVKSVLAMEIKDTQTEVHEKISSVIFWICVITAVILVAVLGGALVYIQKSINNPIKTAIEGMTEASNQVASASGQVSTASQTLAEGSSEQAASIEETSSSLEEMSSMTKQNADNADQANSLMNEANRVVGLANTSMGELTESMGGISKASEETSKIIKTIDEIAFQTNLLALNAAVEAARAGEAGAGFAVVADEVRNLAMRAADAAKNTAELIEDTVKKIGDGTELVNVTGEAFKEVQQSAGKVGELVGEIAAASNEQSQGIGQINTAVAEMDKVVQQNAASAEESASASEEMNAQAEQMKGIVRQLSTMVGGNETNSSKAVSVEKTVQDRRNDTSQAGSQRELEWHKTPRRGGKKEVNPEDVIPMDDDFKDF